jgi:class 3 adenylate cyclase
VFLLLETVYGAFDALAKRRRVFKVETIGDCYVAVCGVPQAQKDHAVIIARFARDIHSKMQTLVEELEVALGPDTADLAFRIGMHSAGQSREECSAATTLDFNCSMTR